jgi:regulator of nucleoside diphosphate kinase
MDVFSDGQARPPIHLVDVESDLVSDLALRAEHRHPVVAAMLLAEIERAELHSRERLPKGVITLGAEVDFVDEKSRQKRTVRLVLPGEANIALGRISILTPVGAALYGLSAGQSIDWPDLSGQERRIRITAVRQPPDPKPAAA